LSLFINPLGVPSEEKRKVDNTIDCPNTTIILQQKMVCFTVLRDKENENVATVKQSKPEALESNVLAY